VADILKDRKMSRDIAAFMLIKRAVIMEKKKSRFLSERLL